MSRIGCRVMRFLSKICRAAGWIVALALLVAVPGAAQDNGSSISPYTILFEWNRTNLSQFTKTCVPNCNNLSEVFYSTQPNANYAVTPMVLFTGGTWGVDQDRYFVSNDIFSPAADEDLVIEADAGYGSGAGLKHGVGCFDPQDPTAASYVLARNGSSYWQLNKFVGGTLYVQATPNAPTGYGAGVGTKFRIRFVVTSTGRVRVYLFGMSVMDVPMTLGNSTVLTSCRVGVVVKGVNDLYMSNLRVFRMKAEGEQLF